MAKGNARASESLAFDIVHTQLSEINIINLRVICVKCFLYQKKVHFKSTVLSFFFIACELVVRRDIPVCFFPSLYYAYMCVIKLLFCNKKRMIKTSNKRYRAEYKLSSCR